MNNKSKKQVIIAFMSGCVLGLAIVLSQNTRADSMETLHMESHVGNTAYMVMTPRRTDSAYRLSQRLCNTQGGLYTKFETVDHFEVICNNDKTMSYFLIKR